MFMLTSLSDTGPDTAYNAAIRSILKGLNGRSQKPYYIHTSGAGLIWAEPDGSKAGTKIWDDVADVKALTSMPDGSYHRAGDKAIPTIPIQDCNRLTIA